MLCLLMVKKRLLIGVLLVKQKFIWIVPGPVNGELQISGFPANFPGQLAQDFFDLPGLTILGAPVSDNHTCVIFYLVEVREAPKASDSCFAASLKSRALLCKAWIDNRQTGPEIPIAPTT